MRTKTEINAEYADHLKQFADKRWSALPKVLIVGCDDDNIGKAISEYFCLPMVVRTKDELDLPQYDFDWSPYDAVIFNNGETHLDWIEDQSAEKIFSVITNSLVSTMISISQIAKQRMYSNYKTKIVVIGSMAHCKVLNGSAPYCAAKAGLQHFIRCTAYELAPKGFELFCVNPSNVHDSPMSYETIDQLRMYRNLSLKEAQAYWANECPMGSFLTKDEIAIIVHDLITSDKKYLSGSAIDLIGGQR